MSTAISMSTLPLTRRRPVASVNSLAGLVTTEYPLFLSGTPTSGRSGEYSSGLEQRRV